MRPNDKIFVAASFEILAIIGLIFVSPAIASAVGLVCFFSLLFLNRYVNRIYSPKFQGKITWLDWMQIRDLMATSRNYEAVVLALRRAYGIDEKQLRILSPDDLHNLLVKLRTEQNSDGL